MKWVLEVLSFTWSTTIKWQHLDGFSIPHSDDKVFISVTNIEGSELVFDSDGGVVDSVIYH